MWGWESVLERMRLRQTWRQVRTGRGPEGTMCYINVYYKDKYTQEGVIKTPDPGPKELQRMQGGEGWATPGVGGWWDQVGQHWTLSPRFWIVPGNDQVPRSCIMGS